MEPRSLLSAAPVLFADLNDEPYAEYSDAATLRGNLYFLANTSRGTELWSTNGTPKGTTLVRSLPGAHYRPSDPAHDMAVAGKYLYFPLEGAQDQPPMLWRTDGTADGTIPLTQVTGFFGHMVELRNRLLFTIEEQYEQYAFWVTDGSPAGTTPLNLKQPLRYVNYLTPVRGRVVFRATTQHHPMDVWQTDGTRKGTRPLHAPVSSGMAPHTFVPAGRRLLYLANTPYSERIFSTDLRTHTLVKEIPSDGNDDLDFVVGNERYLLFRNHRNGRNHLLRVDARSGRTSRLKRMNDTNFGNSIRWQQTPSGIVLLNNAGALWRSDGTDAGTYVLRHGQNDLTFDPVGDQVFFARETTDAGWELWTTDGTRAGTRQVTDLLPGPDGGFRRAIGTVRGRAIFLGNQPNGGNAIYASDGTDKGTRRLTSLADRTYPSDPHHFTSVGDELFYVTPHYSGCCVIRGPVLWKTSAAGDRQHLLASFPGDVVGRVVPLRHGVVFDTHPFSLSTVGGVATWVSDGTPDGTRRLTDDYAMGAVIDGRYVFYDHTERRIRTSDGREERGLSLGQLFPGAEYVREIATDGSELFFSVKRRDGQQLWTTESDLSRPKLLADVPGHVVHAVAGDADTFLLVEISLDEYALWSTNGTPDGTRPRATSLPDWPYMATLGNTLYYTTSDAGHGYELWVLAPDARRLVKDINPGPTGSGPQYLLAMNGRLYFRADDGQHGAELWTSDGTPAGTHLVADVHPGPLPGLVSYLYPAAGALFFAGDDGVHGQEPWRSDGTGTGTVLVHDIATGPTSSEPGGWRLFSDKVVFSADDQVHGREPWYIPLDDER